MLTLMLVTAVRVLMVHTVWAGGSVSGNVHTETPAGFGDACGATAEVNTDSRVGVTDNVQNTGCAGSISGDNAEMMGVVLTVTVIVVLTVLVAMQIIVLGISEDASSGSGNSAGHTVSASHHYCCL